MNLELILLLILGAALGSFIGAYSWRVPKGKSIIYGRSICDHCHREIEWYDNIPIVSFIALKGSCRNCHQRISWRYPVIEAAAALGLGGLYLFIQNCPALGVAPVCLWSSWLGPLSIAVLGFLYLVTLSVFIIDFENQIIPDELVFIGFILIFAIFVLGGRGDFYANISSSFFAALFLLAIYFLTKGKGMGLGDVKFALVPAFFLGLRLSIIWMFGAFLTGSIVGLILVLSKKAKFGKQIAFGPFLAFSFIVIALWGEKVLAWLIR